MKKLLKRLVKLSKSPALRLLWRLVKIIVLKSKGDCNYGTSKKDTLDNYGTSKKDTLDDREDCKIDEENLR